MGPNYRVIREGKEKFLLHCTMCFIGFSLAPASRNSKGYQNTRLNLANDKYLDTQGAAKALVGTLNHWLEDNSENHPQYTNVVKMRTGAVNITKVVLSELGARGPAELRARFGALSEGMVLFIRKAPELQAAWQLFFCPMVTTYPYWIQANGEKLANPYMGLAMPNCGSKKPW